MTRRKPKTDLPAAIRDGLKEIRAGKVRTTVTVRGVLSGVTLPIRSGSGRFRPCRDLFVRVDLDALPRLEEGQPVTLTIETTPTRKGKR